IRGSRSLRSSVSPPKEVTSYDSRTRVDPGWLLPATGRPLDRRTYAQTARLNRSVVGQLAVTGLRLVCITFRTGGRERLLDRYFASAGGLTGTDRRVTVRSLQQRGEHTAFLCKLAHLLSDVLSRVGAALDDCCLRSASLSAFQRPPVLPPA